MSPRKLLWTLAALLALLFPLTSAHSASLFSGEVELVKTEDSPRLYAVVNGKRHHVRSPDILRSYAYRGKQVRVVSAESFDRLSSVRLVKSPAGPRVYRLNHRTGQKLWIPTEGSFVGAGERWDDIVEISATDSRAYRNARLVKTADDPRVYLLDYDSITRHPILSEKDFVAGGFRWRDILTVSKPVLEAYALAEPFDPDAKPVVAPPTDVSTSPDRPATETSVTAHLSSSVREALPSGTARNVVAELRLEATGASTQLRGLTVRKEGLLRDSDVTSVSLVDQDGFLLARPQPLVNSTAQFTFTNPVTLSAGKAARLRVVMSFAPQLSSNGLSFNLRIDKDDLALGSRLVGNFPLKVENIKVFGVTNILGSFTVESEELSSTWREVNAGATKRNLNRFIFSAEASQEDILLERVVFTLQGSARVSDFKNFRVLGEIGNERGATIVKSVHDESVVAVVLNKPYPIPRGETRRLTLQADVVGGVGRLAQFVIANDYDVHARGEEFNFAITPEAGSADGSFAVGDGDSDGYNGVRIRVGDVLLAAREDSPTGPITKGADNVVLGRFEIKPTGRKLRWDKVNVGVELIGGGTPLTNTLRLRQKGTTASLLVVDAAQVSGTSRRYSLAKPPTIAAGKSFIVEVVGSISEQATISDAYRVTLSGAEFIVPESGERVQFTGEARAPSRTVRQVTLLVRHENSFTKSEAIAGKSEVLIGKLKLQASAGEAVQVKEVVLTPAATSAVRFSDGFSDLKLGNARIASPIGGPYRLKIDKRVAAGKTETIELRVTTDRAADGQVVAFRVSDVEAVGDNSNARLPVTFDDVVTPSITFKKTTATFAANDQLADGTRVRGPNTVVGSFMMGTSGVEKVRLESLVLTETANSDGLSVTRGYRNLRLVFAANGNRTGSAVANPVGGVGGDKITDGPEVNAGDTIRLNVLVDATDAEAGDTIELQLSSVVVKGVNTGKRLEPSNLPATGQTITLE